jgi:hypothetical protein
MNPLWSHLIYFFVGLFAGVCCVRSGHRMATGARPGRISLPAINPKEWFKAVTGKEPKGDILTSLEGKPKDDSKRWSATAAGGSEPPPAVMARNSIKWRDQGLAEPQADLPAGMSGKDAARIAQRTTS